MIKQKHFLSFFLIFFILTQVHAQSNVVATAVPNLRINLDAISGAMGETGIATSASINAIFYNSSKLIFSEAEGGALISYMPWLRSIGVGDIYSANLAGFYKINELGAVGGSIRYNSLGEYIFTDFTGAAVSSYKPREVYLDMAYSAKLTDRLSAGLTLKYVHSDLGKGVVISGNEVKVGKAVAADISVFYSQELPVGEMNGDFSAGLSITNMGNKVSYFTNNNIAKDFLPTNLGIGLAYDLRLYNGSRISLAYDANKLLVPTPKADDSHLDKSVIGGMFTSFTDAPFKEEMAEITHSLGLESFIRLFEDGYGIVRAGLFREHITKGNRKYVTFGLGFRYKPIEVAASRIFDDMNNPLKYKSSLLFHF